MSRTYRRKKYEKESRKTKGSKISGEGFYTQVVYEEYSHPYKKRKILVDGFSPLFGKAKVWELTDLPERVFVPTYKKFDINLFYKEFNRIHGDNHPGQWSAPSSFRRYLNKKLDRKYKELIFKEVKGKDYYSEPVYKKSADWDFF
jgi:hypothetical protein